MKCNKLVSVLLAAALVLTLAACGGQAAAGNGGTTGADQNNTSEPQTAEPQTAEPATAPAEAGSESGQSNEAQDTTAEAPAGGKILVAYFSATNHTEGIAQKLAEGLGADLYEITPEEPYTDEDLDYGNPESRTSVEQNDPDARPAIAGTVEDMAQYDVVLIGYPIWWGTAPRIMNTFIERYDFTGKTLAAFCTSASSGFGSSDAALREAASGATWLDGQRFSAGASAEDVLAWTNGLRLT